MCAAASVAIFRLMRFGDDNDCSNNDDDDDDESAPKQPEEIPGVVV